MPSLHTAWAVWVALTVMAMTPRWRWWVLGWLHVALTVFFVVVTGNHYVIDVVAGAVTVAVAWLAVSRLRSQRLPRLSPAAAERIPAWVES